MMCRPASSRFKTLGSIGLLALLAACNNAGQPKQQAPATPQANAVQRQPGSWQSLRYTISFEGSGLAAGMAAMVAAGRAGIGKKDFGGPTCLPAAMVAGDDLNARLQEAIRFGPEWRVTRAVVQHGTVDFHATLGKAPHDHGEMTITGQISPTTTDLVLTTDSYQAAPGKGHIHTVMKQENTRLGPCTAGG